MDDKRYHLKLDYKKENGKISYFWLSNQRIFSLLTRLSHYGDQIVKVEIKEAKPKKEGK